MKQRKYLSLLIMALALVAGCASPVFIQQSDGVNLANYKTYMWVDTRANEKDNAERATAYADISIRNSVNAALVKSGWKKWKKGPMH